MAEPTMREQIARAICRKHWPDEQFWKGYLPDVDAFLAVLERPTETMCDVGEYVSSEWLNDNAPIGQHMYRDPTKAAFTAMIRAAREGK